MGQLKGLVIVIFFSPLIAFCQNDSAFPYKGGERQLLNDFLEFYAHNTKININECQGSSEDSAGIYLVQIKYLRTTKKIQVNIYGSTGKDSLTTVIRNFFNYSVSKWSMKFLKKTRIIIPVVILNTCHMQADKIFIDWLQFGWNHNMRSGPCFFVSPVYHQFFYNPPDIEN